MIDIGRILVNSCISINNVKHWHRNITTLGLLEIYLHEMQSKSSAVHFKSYFPVNNILSNIVWHTQDYIEFSSCRIFVVVSKAHTFRRYWKGIWLAVNTRVLGLLTFSSLNGNNFVFCPENKKDRRINFKFSRFNRRRLTTFITNTLSNMSVFPLQDLLGQKIQCIIFIVYF